jgi:hypothetical protein
MECGAEPEPGDCGSRGFFELAPMDFLLKKGFFGRREGDGAEGVANEPRAGIIRNNFARKGLI